MKPEALPLFPTFTLDDFTRPPWPEQRAPWTQPRTYLADAEISEVKAHIQFRWRDGLRWSQPDTGNEPPGYVMDRRTSRADEAMAGAHTWKEKQEERAKALFPVLEEEVHAALHGAGWRVIGESSFNGNIWRDFGPAIAEQEERLRVLARQVWHGTYPRQGAEKVAPVEDAILLRVFPAHLWQAIGTDLEAAVDPDAQQLRVRRQRKVGSAQEQQRAAESQRVAVIGDEEARARGATPAFQRTRTTREMTFTCAWCTQTVTQQRYPSPKPMYCTETCEQEAQREKTRVRVQNFEKNGAIPRSNVLTSVIVTHTDRPRRHVRRMCQRN